MIESSDWCFLKIKIYPGRFWYRSKYTPNGAFNHNNISGYVISSPELLLPKLPGRDGLTEPWNYEPRESFPEVAVSKLF